jgi:protein-tyrosine phosphatase
MKSILFVCLGNICRSPLAEGIANEYCNQNNIDLVCESAGTGSWHIGEPPCENSIRVAKDNGIDISSQRARQVTLEDFEKYDIIVGLDDSNIKNLKKLGCKNPLKLGDFGFDGFEGFDKVYNMIEVCVKTLIRQKAIQ